MSTVSVIVPTLNRRSYLEEAVESALAQSHADLECVVVDGGSTDGTQEYLRSIDDERLHVIARDSPRGLSNARNAALDAATGEYVVFLDDDDRLFENAIEVLLETIRDRPTSCAGVCTALRQVSANGRTFERRVGDGTVERIGEMSIKNPSGTLVRADAVAQMGGFDERYACREDADFWIRLFEHFDLYELDRVLYERHCHDGQLSKQPARMLRANERILTDHGDVLADDEIAARYYDMGLKHVELDEPGNARAMFRRAIRQNAAGAKFWYYYFWSHFGSVGCDIGVAGHRRVIRPLSTLGQ